MCGCSAVPHSGYGPPISVFRGLCTVPSACLLSALCLPLPVHPFQLYVCWVCLWASWVGPCLILRPSTLHIHTCISSGKVFLKNIFPSSYTVLHILHPHIYIYTFLLQGSAISGWLKPTCQEAGSIGEVWITTPHILPEAGSFYQA